MKYALLSVGRSACDEVGIELLVMDVEARQTGGYCDSVYCLTLPYLRLISIARILLSPDPDRRAAMGNKLGLQQKQQTQLIMPVAVLRWRSGV